MKIARFFAVIFGILGILLMLGTTVLCLTSLDAPVKLSDLPEAAEQCPVQMMDALAAGDFTAASARMYGQPDLGADQGLTEEAAAVWGIFQSGISYEFTSDFYVSGSRIAIDAVLTVPDITSITDTLDDHARDLMNSRISAATEMAELYDGENNFRQDLIDEVMAAAVEKTLAEEPEMLTVETTVGIVYEQGQWWAIPDQALMTALAGGLV